MQHIFLVASLISATEACNILGLEKLILDMCFKILNFTLSHFPGFRYVPPVDPSSRVSISPQYGSVKSDRSCVVCRRDLDSAPWWLPRPANLIEDSPSLQARWIQLLIIAV